MGKMDRVKIISNCSTAEGLEMEINDFLVVLNNKRWEIKNINYEINEAGYNSALIHYRREINE